MIKIEVIKNGVVKVVIDGKLQAHDIETITPQIDNLIAQFGQIKVLVDARRFNGWINIAAFKYHVNFIKSHYYNVGRLAVVMGSLWQRLTLAVVKMAIKKDIKTFKAKEFEKAYQWISKN